MQHVCEMLPRLLQIIDHPPRTLLTTLETYLSALVFRVPESLLQHAIPALTMTIRASANTQLISGILSRFYNYLQRYHSSLFTHLGGLFLQGDELPPEQARRQK